MPVVLPPAVVSPAVWGQAYGDYEQHGNVAPGSGVDVTRFTRTWGVLIGADWTFRDLGKIDGTLLVGALTGVSNANVTFTNSATRINMFGPSVGAYAKYFLGAFSTDTYLKVDLLTFNQTDPTLTAPVGSTPMDNVTVGQFFNYRFYTFGNAFWLEPTIGLQYSRSIYGSSGIPLGLQNGEYSRVQGGVRFGLTSNWNEVVTTATISALAYDDFAISGYVLDSSIPAATGVLADKGKLRGLGVFNFSFDWGRGLSTFIQADVRGGQDLIGGGGRIGGRFQF
ncbi:autotransporter outer membrane beta-barrel domain-containing protein [Bradyrhizobium sp. Arg68]|uniref:autotransporter outer membrane beta-barrel domain-containing protein n=1 Tax=Bradyrhizobium ivorense TaxID=2511166 RepID=UPI001E4381F2|nr:autotransporter outer membrane beta-barrel domain-containing protein [Bradyrhizobium ivorense]MCC8941072.1 autotransporter outer membrane beta-barrel domain-containing protein [Bradyrhizobium ivorense]